MTERDSLDDEMLADFFGMMHRVVQAVGTWKEKREHILNGLDDSQYTDLQEFISWFDESEEKPNA